jgi:hypothetical protein
LDLLHLIHSQLGTTDNNSAIAILHTLRFAAAHALGFSVFTSLIQAKHYQQSHCHFKSHMKSSFHSLIPFLPLFCNCHFRRLDSIQFLSSRAHIPAGWYTDTRLFTSRLLFCAALCCRILLYNHFAQTTLKTQLLLLRRRLLIRCLAMDAYCCAHLLTRECVYRLVEQ